MPSSRQLRADDDDVYMITISIHMLLHSIDILSYLPRGGSQLKFNPV